VSDFDPDVSRIYREASTEAPPAALDAAILAAARKRVAKPQSRARSSWLRRMAPASALATLLVAVSLAFLVEREQTSRDARDGPIAPQPQPQQAPPARAAESSKPKAADSAAAAVEAKTDAPAKAVPTEKSDAPAATVPAPASRRPEAAAPAAEAFPAESSAKAGENSAKAAAISGKPVENSAKEAGISAKPDESSAKAAESRMSAAKAAAESNVAGDAGLRDLGAAAPAAPAAAGKVAPLRQDAIRRSPEAWLEEISRLRREGRDREAAVQLAEFRKAYPAHAVPEALLPK